MEKEVLGDLDLASFFLRQQSRFPFGHVITEIKHELNLRPLPLVQIVVNVHVCLELDKIANDLLTTLRESSLHVLMRSKAHRRPKRVLNTSLGHAYSVVDPVAASLFVGLNFFPQSSGHLSGENVIRVNLREFQQSLSHGLFYGLASSARLMAIFAIELVPNLLVTFILSHVLPQI